MIKQSQSSGLLIYKGDQVVTYILKYAETSMKPMKYVVNETTGWYAAATDFKIEGDSLELDAVFFSKYKDFYLNDNKATAPKVYHVTDDLIYNEAKKIKAFVSYLDELSDTSSESILAEAKRVIDLHFEIGTTQNKEITSENKRLRMRAKSLVKSLRQFVVEFE